MTLNSSPHTPRTPEHLRIWEQGRCCIVIGGRRSEPLRCGRPDKPYSNPRSEDRFCDGHAPEAYRGVSA